MNNYNPNGRGWYGQGWAGGVINRKHPPIDNNQ